MPETSSCGRNTHSPQLDKRQDGYLEIADYAIIGNLHTAALVSKSDASIDSFCFPDFDSPSVFARILDKDIGGHFSISPREDVLSTRQQYVANTAILTTKFLGDHGVSMITDYMPRCSPLSRTRTTLLPWVCRKVEVIRGKVDFRLECFPAFDYARASHTSKILGDDKILDTKNAVKGRFDSNGMSLELKFVTHHADVDEDPTIELKTDDESYPKHKGPGITSDFSLTEGQSVTFILREICKETKDASNPTISNEYMELVQSDTQQYWNSWTSSSKYSGRWREFVARQAITLKLLTFEPTGAIVAAVTFSLPEGMNGEGRNWDYRYSWIRDASFTVYSLIRLGFTAEANSYMSFIQARIKDKGDKPLQIVYGIRGETDLEEKELNHLSGYKDQRPVRIGNGAADHLQLDVYGELMDAIYLSSKYGRPCSWQGWLDVRHLCDYVCENWNMKDMSIWEVRNSKQDFTYSRIMCWVALDRGLRLSDKRSFPLPQREKWLKVRDEIYEDIQTNGWSEEHQFYCQSYQNKAVLDSAMLIMPLVFFSSPVDERFISTLNAILKTPEKGGLTTNNLVYRYDVEKAEDGVGGEEGAFCMCSFWCVEALIRAGQYDPSYLGRARSMFEDLIGYANHVDLFAEEISKAGTFCGNFPQGFTAVAAISAAFNLDRVLAHRVVGGPTPAR